LFVNGISVEPVDWVPSVKKGVEKVYLLIAVSLSGAAVVTLETDIENGRLVTSSRVVAGYQFLEKFFHMGRR